MKIEDLRIGNIVSDGENVFQIGGITEGWNNIYTIYKRGTNTNILQKEIKPIAITEDRLLNCGFKKNSKDQYILGFSKGANHPIYIEFEFVGKEVFGSFWIGKKPTHKTLLDIHYLHELQNLFYELTKTELEITRIWTHLK